MAVSFLGLSAVTPTLGTQPLVAPPPCLDPDRPETSTRSVDDHRPATAPRSVGNSAPRIRVVPGFTPQAVSDVTEDAGEDRASEAGMPGLQEDAAAQAEDDRGLIESDENF